MDNNHNIVVYRKRDYKLQLSSDLSMVLLICCYSPDMEGNIFFFIYALYKDGLNFELMMA